MNQAMPQRLPAKTFDGRDAVAFRQNLQAWLRKVVPGYIGRMAAASTEQEHETVQSDWDAETFSAGYSGISWPVEHGGQGLGPVEEIIFYEESAIAGAPKGLTRFAQHLLGQVLLEFGTPEQKARFLHGIVSGKTVWCQGSSEPGAGSDLPAISTRAIRTDSGYRINGRKIWTSHAHLAGWCWLLARTSETEPRYRNLSLLLVDMTQSAIRKERIKQITGDSRFSEVTFDGARAELDNVVGGENKGWQTMVAALGRERGIYQSMWRFIELTWLLKQARECVHHTGRGALSTLDGYHAAVMAVKYQVQRCVEGRMAGRDMRGPETMLKLYWSELWQKIATFGMDCRCPHHVDGFRNSYFESRASTIWGGTSEIQRNTIADHVLRLPRAKAGV